MAAPTWTCQRSRSLFVENRGQDYCKPLIPWKIRRIGNGSIHSYLVEKATQNRCNPLIPCWISHLGLFLALFLYSIDIKCFSCVGFVLLRPSCRPVSGRPAEPRRCRP